jgi:hypothetical protein
MELSWSDLAIPFAASLVLLAILLRRPLGLILYAFVPSVSRLHPEAEDFPDSVLAEEKYGPQLRTAGFEHLGAYQFSLPLSGTLGSFDCWAAPSLGVFGLVWPNASQLLLVSYFEPGPAAVATSDAAGEGFRRPGHWSQSRLDLHIGSLLAKHLAFTQAFTEAGGTGLRPWSDLTLPGLWAADRAFNGGPGRPRILRNALRTCSRVLLAYFLAIALMAAVVFGSQLLKARAG